jgi:DNA polymerase III sliding clamp (beta) subunit (PCNA family)
MKTNSRFFKTLLRNRRKKLIANVNRKDLLDAAKKASRAASRDTGIAVLKGILFEADERAGLIRLTASDLSAAISVSLPAYIETGGAAVIANTGLFLEYLALMPCEDLHLALSGDGHTLKIGSDGCSARVEIRALPEKDYPRPDIPMPGETVYVTGLKSLIARTAFMASDDPGRPVLGCVKLTLSGDGISAEAISGFGLAKATGDGEAKGDISLLIPAPVLKTLARISDDGDVFELGVTGGGKSGKVAVFFDGTLILAARLAEGEMPDTESFVRPLTETARISVRAKELSDALGRAAAFAPKGIVDIAFADGGISLKCETGEIEASGFVSAIPDTAAAPSPGVYGFNAARLAECVRAAGGNPTLILTAGGHLVIKTENARYLQLAVSPKAAAADEAAA